MGNVLMVIGGVFLGGACAEERLAEAAGMAITGAILICLGVAL